MQTMAHPSKDKLASQTKHELTPIFAAFLQKAPLDNDHNIVAAQLGSKYRAQPEQALYAYADCALQSKYCLNNLAN